METDQEDTHFILGLIAGLCQFEDRDESMLAVLVEQLRAREKFAAKTKLRHAERIMLHLEG